MEKDVLITISGLQEETGPEGTVEVAVSGEYYKRGETHYVKYQQYDQETDTTTDNMIKIKGDTVEIKRSGVVSSNMVFKQNTIHNSFYDTVVGSMAIETRTGTVLVQEADHSMDVKLEYELYMNEAFISNCEVTIRIEEK